MSEKQGMNFYVKSAQIKGMYVYVSSDHSHHMHYGMKGHMHQ